MAPRNVSTIGLLALALLLGTTLGPHRAPAATITIVNNDGAGEGFNDPTPAIPVGGNTGTTVGAQRLFVFNHAASIWGSILPSDVTIQVRAQFNTQFCDATSAVLGSAGAITVHANFSGAEFSNMWYHQALANKLAGSDLDATNPDINATFNSALNGDPGCLGGIGWYYGIDGDQGTEIELLPVVLHEIAHGLGFSTFTNNSTGQFLSGLPDIYAHFIFDKTRGQHWDQITNNNQRKQSATNTGNLVWNGSAVTYTAPYVLDRAPELIVNDPGSIAGPYASVKAEFGAALDPIGVTAEIVLVDDGVSPTSDACSPLVNGAQVSGRIAILDRGTCNFTDKVAAAQAAGAIAAIVVNNAPTAPIVMGGSDPSITIPAVMISQSDGATIKTELLSGPVTATLRGSATVIAGTHPDGQVRLYAPNPLQAGSSVSHFDDIASPNLLMEPAINDDLHDTVDLTKMLFEDIGWLPRLTAVEPVAPTPVAVLRARSMPNPFRPSTVIRLELPGGGTTRVEVYDIHGRMVKRLVDQWLPAGNHAVTWDGTDARGARTGAGVYFTRIVSNDLRATQRLVKLND
jgi:hypothetical protein